MHARTLNRLWPWLLCTVVCGWSQPASSAPGAEPEALAAWLKAQTNVHTWTASFTQTRTLKSLAQPLVNTGRVWFMAPSQFRWELGQPPQTIALRQTNQVFLIYPRLKRVEKYPLDGPASGPWKDAMALLEAGFPGSQAGLETRFKVLEVQSANELCALTLQPKLPAARRLMPSIKVVFGAKDLGLQATEIQFADGSSLRNDFTNAVLNPQLDTALFQPAWESDFKVVEPLKR